MALRHLIASAMWYKPDISPSLDVAPASGLLACPTLNQCKRTFEARILRYVKAMPHHLEWSRGESVLRVVGHADIYLRGLNEDKGESVFGLRLLAAAIDEVQSIPPDTLEVAVLPALSDTPYSSLLLTGTPKGRAHPLYQWLHRYLPMERLTPLGPQRESMAQVSARDWTIYSFPSHANPYIPLAELERQERTMHPKRFAQEHLASWATFEEQIWDSFDRNLNVDDPPFDLTDPTASGQFKALWVGLDFGDRHQGMALIGQHKTTDELWVLEAWSTSGSLGGLDRQIEVLQRWQARWPFREVYCDPSRPASILELRKAGFPKAVSAQNHVQEGLSYVNQLWYSRELKVPTYLDEKLSPLIESYAWKPGKEGLEEDPRIRHEIPDSLRYALWTRHRVRKL